MRRIALFSDIHANLPALDAVLADIDACGVTERYCLGDLVGYGPWPAETIGRIRELGIPTIQGNYDEGIGNRRGECGCYYSTAQARADGAASYAFTDAAVGGDEAAWLAALPDHIRLEEGGCRILLAHGSPRKVNEYLLPDRSDRQLARLAAEAGADVVCVGHVHVPYHRAIPAQPSGTSTGGSLVHYVSSGSVGKPKDGDPRACWVELVLGAENDVRAAASDDPAVAPCRGDGSWLGYVVHRPGYDVRAVAQAVVGAGLPRTLAEALVEA
jgi:predicted phosphodiesterase